MAFWGKILKAGETPVEVPDEVALVITQATLPAECKGVTTVTLHKELDEGEPESERTPPIVVAHLEWGKREQVQLEITFAPGDKFKLEVKGSTVHILGYITPLDMFGDDESMDMDEDSDEGVIYPDSDSDSDETAAAIYAEEKAKRKGTIQELPSDSSDNASSDDGEPASEDEAPKQNPKKRGHEEPQKKAPEAKKPKAAESAAQQAPHQTKPAPKPAAQSAKPATPQQKPAAARPAASPKPATPQSKPAAPAQSPKSPDAGSPGAGGDKKKRKRNKNKNKTGASPQ